jgi:hypothetical protein
MADRQEVSFSLENAYYPSTALIKGVPNCLIAGQNLLLRGRGVWTSARGCGNSIGSAGAINPALNVGSGFGGLTGGGSVTQAFAAGVYFYAGSGQLYVNGSPVGNGVEGGTVTIWTGSDNVPAGIAAPGAPTIASTGAGGRNNGSYSVGVTAIRASTGGESIVSPPSASLSVANQGIKITALPGFPSDADRVGIYVTKRGFGDTGPLFHFYDVAKSTVLTAIGSGGYTIQLPGDSTAGWIDAQLGDLAPLDYNLPPPCTHVFSINSVIVAAGCYGGAGLSPSYPNKPEAYPVRFVLFIPGGGTITAIKGSGIEGAVLVGTISSLNLVTASSSTDSPLNIRPIWPTTGISSANQICIIGAEIFAWVGGRGPIRDSLASSNDPGDEATAFAAPVMKAFAANGYAAGNVTVVYDPPSDTVWYVKGTIAIGYCRYLQQWHTPYILPASIVTAVTTTISGDSRALLIDGSGNEYIFENGSGALGGWSMITQFQGALGPTAIYPMTFIGLRGIVSATCRGDLYTDMNVSTPNAAASNLTMGASHGIFHHLNVQNVKSVALGMSGTDSGGLEISGADGLKIVHTVRV